MSHEVWSTLFLFAVSLFWIKIIEGLVKRDRVSVELSRKAIHVGIGVLFVMCWSVFDVHCYSCRYLAALVPLSVVIKFLAICLGVLKDPITVKMLCRDGENHPQQLLLGPLMYGIVIISSTIYYWLDSPEGLITILILTVGDGMAAIGGKFMPITRLPWNRTKSLGGLLSFMILSFMAIVLSLIWFTSLGYPNLTAGGVLLTPLWLSKLFCICFSSALLESTELGAFDNLIVPIFALLLTKILL